MPNSDSPRIQALCKRAKEFFTLNNKPNSKQDFQTKEELKIKFDNLLKCLEAITLLDVGIEDIEPYQDHHIFMPIFESDLFVIWVFVLPKHSSGLPLHNHPNMSILSKFLHGKAQIITADFISSDKMSSKKKKKKIKFYFF